jgi:hypothetical protein
MGFLPCIVGILVACGAIATGIARADISASNCVETSSCSTVSARTPVSSGTTRTPPAIQPNSVGLLPRGQVWECVVNGQRTFSDVRCGAHSSVRQLSQLNVMDAEPAMHGPPFHLYDSEYMPAAIDQNAPDFVTEGQEVFWLNERRGSRHTSSHVHHGHGRPR